MTGLQLRFLDMSKFFEEDRLHCISLVLNCQPNNFRREDKNCELLQKKDESKTISRRMKRKYEE